MARSSRDTFSGEFENIAFLFDSSRKISLDLKFPVDTSYPPSTTVEQIPSYVPLEASVRARCRQIWVPLTAWITSFIATILYSLFIYRVLIVSNPKIGSWIVDASEANLLLSIFSQLYAMLLLFMLQGLLDAMRWTLASRADEGGTSASNFFQLSPGTNWYSVCRLIYNSGFRNSWGLLRLALPFVGLAFGSLLKFQNTFEYHFVSGEPTIDVFAGTLIPDITTLSSIPTSYMAAFFDTWAQQLNNFPRYAKTWSLDSCTGECSSMFLPGGMEIARRVGPFLNTTVLKGGTFENVEAISIESAPGLALRFDPLDDDFKFDIETECKAYISMGDGMQMCLRQMNDSIAAGWRACPTLHTVMKSCKTIEYWGTEPLETKTLMTVYRQNATTIYSRDSLAIQQITKTSEPKIALVSASDTRAIWDHIFTPRNKSGDLDYQSINVTLHRLAWKYRTYFEWFPDDDAPVEQLQNFLAVPMQFGVTAMQYTNYTMVTPEDKRDFTREMVTTATGGKSIQKFVGQTWTSWTFITAGIFVVLSSGSAFWWIITRGNVVPNPSGVIEIDFASKLVGTARQSKKESNPDSDIERYRDMVRDSSQRMDTDSASLFKAFKRWRVEIEGTEKMDQKELQDGYPSLLKFSAARNQLSDDKS
ncbi:hypothetical protein V2G26_005795 [Clonostachys chloroleuca]